MSIKDNTRFEKLILANINRYLPGFEKDYAKHRNKATFAKEEHSRIHSLISALHNSNDELNTAFFAVQKKRQTDNKLEYPSAIKQHFKNSVLKQNKLFKFSANLLALYQLADLILSRTNPKSSEIKGDENAEYTQARAVLTISYLLQEIHEKDRNSKGTDKTEIARFIHALTTGKNSKNISNSNVYMKVKDLFDDPSKGSKKDLLYVKEKFESLGLVDIVRKIDLALAKR